MWGPAGEGRWDAVVRRGWELGAMGVRVGVGHVGRHVAVVLVVVSSCPASLLVHVGVVRGGRHRVVVVGRVVCRGGLARGSSAVGRGHAELVQTAKHLSLHLKGHGGSAIVLVHQLHGGGIVIHMVRHGRGVLRVQLHVGQGRDARGRRGLEGVTRGRWWGQVRRVGGYGRVHGGAKVL